MHFIHAEVDIASTQKGAMQSPPQAKEAPVSLRYSQEYLPGGRKN